MPHLLIINLCSVEFVIAAGKAFCLAQCRLHVYTPESNQIQEIEILTAYASCLINSTAVEQDLNPEAFAEFPVCSPPFFRVRHRWSVHDIPVEGAIGCLSRLLCCMTNKYTSVRNSFSKQTMRCPLTDTPFCTDFADNQGK